MGEPLQRVTIERSAYGWKVTRERAGTGETFAVEGDLVDAIAVVLRAYDPDGLPYRAADGLRTGAVPTGPIGSGDAQ